MPVTDLVTDGQMQALATRIATAIKANRNDISTEEAARIAADLVLQGNIDVEASARVAADALRVLKAGDTMSGALTVNSHVIADEFRLGSGEKITWGASYLQHFTSTGAFTFFDGIGTLLDLRTVSASLNVPTTVDANLLVTGDLTVQGTSTTVNSTTVTIADPVLTLGDAATINDGKDRGVEFKYGNGVATQTGFFGWDRSANAFTAIAVATNTNEVFAGTPGNFIINNITANDVTLNNVSGATAAFAGQVNASQIGFRDSDGSHRMILRTTENLTADRLVTINPGNADRILTLSGNASLNQSVLTSSTPTFAQTILSAAAPTLATHATRKDYVDTAVTGLQNQITAHLNDPEDAHDATAISFVPGVEYSWLNGVNVQLGVKQTADRLALHLDAATNAHSASAISYVAPTSPILDAWLVGVDRVDEALTAVIGQLYQPDAEATAALIAAANALATGDPTTDPNVLSSDLIVAKHFLAGSIQAVDIDTVNVRAAILTANSVNGTTIDASSSITIGTGVNTISLQGTALPATTKLSFGNATYGTGTGMYADASGRFSLGDKLTFDGAGNLSVAANFSAGTIDIGGNDATSFHVNAAGDLWSGSDQFLTAKFRVSSGGVLRAESGLIGGWDLTASLIQSVNDRITLDSATERVVAGAGVNKIILQGGLDDANTKLYIGAGSHGLANTPVYMDGRGWFSLGANLTWNGVTLTINGGGTFTGALVGGTIEIGTGESVFKADTNGIYLGSATFGSAEFRVTPAGVLTSTSGSIGGWSINTTEITSGSTHLTAAGNLYNGTGTYNTSTTPWWLGADGSFSLRDKLRVDTAGALTVEGNITANSLTMLDGAGIPAATFSTASPLYYTTFTTGFTFFQEAVAAARTRGVSGGASGGIGVHSAGPTATTTIFSETASELAGGADYLNSSAGVRAESNINTGVANLVLEARGYYGGPTGPAFDAGPRITLTADPAGSSSGINFSNPINFGSTLGDKILLWGDTYKLGIESGTLVYTAGIAHRWRIGGATALYLSSGNLDVFGSVDMNSNSINAVNRTFAAYGSQSVPSYTFTSNPNTGMYGSSTFVALAINAAAKIVCYSTKVDLLANLDVAGRVDAVSAGGASWGLAQLIADHGTSGIAHIALHPGTTAPQLRTQTADNTIFFRNSADSGWATVRAVISDASDERVKQDFAPLPDGAGLRDLMKFEPTYFHWKPEVMEGTEGRHYCELDGCFERHAGHTCHMVEDWRAGEIGLIAQRTAAVDPRYGNRGSDGVFEAINHMAVLATTIKAVQELNVALTAEIAALRDEVTALAAAK